MKERLKAFIEASFVQNTLIALILINAAILGLETSQAARARAGDILYTIDSVILAIFVVEIAIRLYVYRLKFWRDPWSVFDFVVVGIALIPASGPLAVLRALRVLRVLRLLTMVPSMRKVVGALLTAIPGLGSIALVLCILYYVFAVIATNLFAAAFPEWFGTLGRSLYTLFQIMTLESWSMGIVRPVMEEYPYSWIFFITFILVATFTMLNLFIAIIFLEDGKEVHANQGYLNPEEFYKLLGAFKLGNTEAYNVAFQHGTDSRFCKQYEIFKDTPDGVFIDKLSGAPLFDTRDRFNSGTGWLSFTKPVDGSVTEHIDTSYGMTRTEIRSASTGIHLGHVFDDGPNGLPRYCINATVLEFKPRS